MQFEYIHNQDMATFVTIWDGDELMLTSYDEHFSKHLHIPYPIETPLPFHNYIEEASYNHLKKAIRKLDNNYSTFRCFKNINTQGVLLPYIISIVSVPYHGQLYYFGFAVLIKLPLAVSSPDFSLDVNQALYNSTNDLLFTVQLFNNKELQMTTYNAPLLSYLDLPNTPKKNNLTLSDYLPAYVCHFFINNVVHALEYGKTYHNSLHYIASEQDKAKYCVPTKGAFHLDVTFVPLYQRGYRGVLCCAKDISAEVEAKLVASDLLEEYSTLFHATTNAAAVLQVHTKTDITVERINPVMTEFLQQYPIFNLTTLLDCKYWKYLFENRKSIEGPVTLPMGRINFYFKLILIPMMKLEHIHKVIIIIVDNTEQVRFNSGNNVSLTPREKQVITLAAEGEKNSYIASLLGISIGTVKRILSNAYNKLGINSRVELLHYYYNEQLGGPHV